MKCSIPYESIAKDINLIREFLEFDELSIFL